MKFEVGDRVRVIPYREEFGKKGGLNYPSPMKRMGGGEYEIQEISGDYYYFNGYYWREEWVEPIEEIPDIDSTAFENIIHCIPKNI